MIRSFLIAAALAVPPFSMAQSPLDSYNISWDTPGPGSAASMPLGNGDVGLNVWVDTGGDLLFYVSKTDAWGGEKDTASDIFMQQGGVLMKLGLIRVSLSPNPFTAGAPFRQTLRLREGEIGITEGEGAAMINYRIWVDANHPVIHVELTGARPSNVNVTLHDWRLGQGDTILSPSKERLVWYHRNPSSGDPRLADPQLADITFGATLEGGGLTRKDDSTLTSAAAMAGRLISIHPLTATTPVPAQYLARLDSERAATDAIDIDAALDAHRRWWDRFWNRSYIFLRGDATADSIARGYVLQRFVTACAGRGAYPIKFNGSIFVVDNPNWKTHGRVTPMNADFRSWGGQYWFQNTRPMYWPRLMAGDFDLMMPLFRMYRNMLPGNSALVQKYYGHDGAYFQETSPFWGGLPFMGPGEQALYTHHYFTPILELSMMMLDYYDYTGDGEFARQYLLPIASAGLEFFDRHFGRDSAGRLLLDPDNSIEMFWKVHDPAPDIAGLHAVLKRMLDLPSTIAPEPLKDRWRRLLAILPSLPVDPSAGADRLLPYTGPQTAQSHNYENPELYAIYPFRLYGLGKPGLELARHTFDIRKCPQEGCWSQDPIQAAMLGYTDVAKEDVRFALTRKDPDLKFPAFWASGNDYKPDEDNGGNGENGLQKMLMQTVGRKILLLPAWPADWDADFRLHAPYHTVVEGKVRNGRLTGLVVTPAARRADIVMPAAAPPRPPYKDPNASVARRVEDLLTRMTVEEKIHQLDMYWGKEVADMGSPNDEGHEATAWSEHKTAASFGDVGAGSVHDLYPLSAGIANSIQRYAMEKTRLGIPVLFIEEGLHGYSGLGSTSFPVPLQLSGAWDTALLYDVGRVIATETRAHGVDMLLAPVLCLPRDPRWGRTEETYGEDTWLDSRNAVAMVKGLQGKGVDRPDAVISEPKHFAVHGIPEAGSNTSPVNMGEREVRSSFLPVFEAAVREGGALAMMAAYSELDGIPCVDNKWLLTDVLRREWGFKGFVLSDLGAIKMSLETHHVAADAPDALAQALKAGLNMQFYDWPHAEFMQAMKTALRRGSLTEEQLNRAVRDVLRVKFLLGLFDHPYTDTALSAHVFHTAASRDLALKAAAESICLLKNEGGVLPLRGDVHNVAVIGPLAVSTYLGGYSNPQAKAISILDGLRRRVGSNLSIRYEQGYSEDSTGQGLLSAAIDAVNKADVAIVALGEEPDIVGENKDRAHLELSEQQLRLIKAVSETGKPVVVLLCNGRPLCIDWVAAHIPAIVETWFSGEQGGLAIADVLLGRTNPSGKLPMTFPRSEGQIPFYYNYKPSSLHRYVDEKDTPLFPFGYGLSYTHFGYGDLKVTPAIIPAGASADVAVTVTNTGAVAGAEVAELYVRELVSSVTTPLLALKGFGRVMLKPGESRTLHFRLGPDQLAIWNREMKKVVEPGEFDILVGGSSADIRLTGSLRVSSGGGGK